jgi:adenylylsulfate kinase-like enzyme/phosphohistidine swiveling domain-containing protein
VDLPRVFWITGLSAVGKTTIGLLLLQRLREHGRQALFLDGDGLRSVIADDLGYDKDARKRSAMRNGRLCQMIAHQGFDVVCSTISLLHEVHAWNRANIPGYREIYLRAPLNELERRDPKNLYARARRGEIADVAGVDVAVEEPRSPDLVIDNFGSLTPEAAVNLIWQHLVVGSEPAAGSAKVTMNPSSGFAFGTKAETLDRLVGCLSSARVLPQVRFTVAEWLRDQGAILDRLAAQSWGAGPVIVRSSARTEDGRAGSLAGKYESIGDVTGTDALKDAIGRVIASYDSNCGDDQVFIQPMLSDIASAGVAFNQDPNSGGPYIVINYDDVSHRADLVTSGGGGALKTFYLHRQHGREHVPDELIGVVRVIDELEMLTGSDALDIEFAVDGAGNVVLLQVRPLVLMVDRRFDLTRHAGAVSDIARTIELRSRPHPFLYGKRTVYGVMPDWNPAEIVGLKPRPLALSLYRDLVTDSIWAYQRDNYGYKNLRSFPLLISFHGLPYIDVRVSFNSFVPHDIDGDLAERLVSYYIDRLLAQPSLHDKVEFEIIFSCYTLDLPERLQVLSAHGFSEDDRARLSGALWALTNRIINSETGLWRKDRNKTDRLAERASHLHDARIDTISRIYWLLEDCKRYGTLPFAGLARAGFIAVQLLRSLVSVGVLNEAEYGTFLANLNTVSSRIGNDFAHLARSEFLSRYGHLRPGTYDILSPRYDEDPNRYFDWSEARNAEKAPPRFALSMAQMRRIDQLLKEHRIDHDVIGLMEFIQAAIEGREYAKFMFTRNLSDALSLIKQLGAEHGISVEDCSFLDIGTVQKLYSESGSVAARLQAGVAEGKRKYELAQSLVLPPIIVNPSDAYVFQLPPTEPNFITQKSFTGAVATLDDPPERFAGKILFIPSADPGFDWIFTRKIGGFITQFGGVNSHMSIRAAELGLPAVVGAGESLYRRWISARRLCLDCGSRQVQILS